MRWPFSQTSPEVGVSNPATIRRRVVLPHPEGPSSEKNAPRGTSSETSSTARCVAKSFDTWRSWSSVSGGIHPSLSDALSSDRQLRANTLANSQHAHANASGADALVVGHFFRGVALQALLQQGPIAFRAHVEDPAHLDLLLQTH